MKPLLLVLLNAVLSLPFISLTAIEVIDEQVKPRIGLSAASPTHAEHAEVGRYEVFEQAIAYPFAGANPWEEVALEVTLTSPSGEVTTIRGFHYDTGEWRFRFAPDEVGVWNWSYTLDDSNLAPAVDQSASGTFACLPSDNPGFVTISPDNPLRLVFTNGTPFHPLGLQDGIGEIAGTDPDHEDLENYTLAADLVHSDYTWTAVRSYALHYPAGTHSIRVAYREGSARLDKLLLTSDPLYLPSGTGQTPSGGTDLWFEAESAAGQPNFSPLAIVADANASGGSSIAAPLGTDSTASAPATGVAEYTFTLAEPTTFYLWGRVFEAVPGENSFWVDVATGGYGYQRFTIDDFLVPREQYFRAHAEEGGFNTWRLNVSNNSFGLWDVIDPAGNLYEVNEGKSFDAVAQTARANGMRLFFAIFGFETHFPFPFDSADPAKMDAVRRYIDYVVARYGAYTDLWELGNEVDQGNYDEDWLTQMAAHLKSVDPYGSPVSFSWERPDRADIEINSPHVYRAESNPANFDTWMRNNISGRRAAGKPILYGEIGNRSPEANFMAYNPLKWRVAAWTAFFEEAYLLYWNTPGTTNYVATAANVFMDEDFRRAHRALADFMPWIPADATRETPTVSNSAVARAYALDSGSSYGAYVYAYADTVNPTSGLTLTINPQVGGTGQWIDPLTGGLVGSSFAVAPGSQVLNVPDFTADIALRVTTGWSQLPGYSAWRVAKGLSLTDADPDLDLDGDGLSNRFELLLGLDPNTAEAAFSSLAVVDQSGQDWLWIDYRERIGADSLSFEASSNLTTWSPLLRDGTTVIIETVNPDPLGDGSAEDLRIKIRIDASLQFIRLQIPM